jgi:hypothetical protein
MLLPLFLVRAPRATRKGVAWSDQYTGNSRSFPDESP